MQQAPRLPPQELLGVHVVAVEADLPVIHREKQNHRNFGIIDVINVSPSRISAEKKKEVGFRKT